MGIFEKIKSFFPGRKEEEVDALEIGLDELGAWIKNLESEKAEPLDEKLEKLRRGLAEESKEAGMLIAELEKAKLEGERIIEKAKDVMEGNKNAYIQKARNFLTKCEPPQDLRMVHGFNALFLKEAQDLGLGTRRSRFITQEFFIKEVSSISASIKKITGMVEDFMREFADSGIEKVWALEIEAKSALEKIEQKKRLDAEAEAIRKEIGKKRGAAKKIIAELEQLKREKEYNDFESLKEKARAVESRINTIRNNLNHMFSEISPALKKFERITTDEKVVRQYLDDPWSALLSDENLRVYPALSKMGELLENGGIEIKDDKKQRIMRTLEGINPEFLKGIISEYSSAKEELDSTAMEIEGSRVAERMRSLEGSSQDHDKDVKELEKRLEAVKKKAGVIDSKLLKEDLKEDVRDATGKEVSII